MTIDEAQKKVLKLLRLATTEPNTEEARTAATTACRLIIEHGLLVMKPSDLVAPSTPKKIRQPSAKEIRETVESVSDTATTTINAASRVVSALNGFSKRVQASRPRR